MKESYKLMCLKPETFPKFFCQLRLVHRRFYSSLIFYNVMTFKLRFFREKVCIFFDTSGAATFPKAPFAELSASLADSQARIDIRDH